MFAVTVHPRVTAPQAGVIVPASLSPTSELGQAASAHRPFPHRAAEVRSRAFTGYATPAPAALGIREGTHAALETAQDQAAALAQSAELDLTPEAEAGEPPEAVPTVFKHSLTDEHLHQLRHGDAAAWDTFVTDWSPRLFSYLRYSLPTREDAEDALSETLVATVEAIKHFDGKSQVSTWLYSIARRKVADFWRKSSNTEELSDLFQAAPNGFSLEFREALAALPEQARQALLLRYREGFSVSEVAEIMGRTYKATESLLSRGRTLLARQLQLETE